MQHFNSLVSAATLAQHLDDPRWVVFDCRFSLADPKAGVKAYRCGHVHNARFIDLDRDLSAAITPCSGRHPLPDLALLAEKLRHWGVGRDSQVVAYDDVQGSFAGRLWWLLRCLGHTAVALLDGGYQQWQAQGLPTDGQDPAFVPGDFVAQLQDGNWIDVAELQDGLRQGLLKLVDARAPERYRGDVEPLDSVAGHVPGAANHWWQSNLGADGRFLPAEQLRSQFMALLGDTPPKQVVHMCGSGVTACHNLVAMEVAGLPGSRLYPGSWSEWIRDTARPTVQGAELV